MQWFHLFVFAWIILEHINNAPSVTLAFPSIKAQQATSSRDSFTRTRCGRISSNLTALAESSSFPLNNTVSSDFVPELVELEESDSEDDDSVLSTQLTPQQVKTRLVVVFMGISGTIDAIFYHTFGRLPNMMTGNTVRLWDSIAGMQWKDCALYGLMLVAYIGGAISYRLTDILTRSSLESRTRNVPTLLKYVAKFSLITLVLSDLISMYILPRYNLDPLWRLPWMSLSFGMINAAANEAFGVVTSAMTGHWTKFGLGTAEVLLLAREESGHQTSTRGLTAFSLSALITFFLYRWVETAIPWLITKLPPMGLCIGLVYAMAFHWYAQYLQL